MLNLDPGGLEKNVMAGSFEGIRTSSYVIYVDLPGATDEMLLLHGYTGAYDRVSRRLAAFVRGLEVSNTPRPLYGSWDDVLPREDLSWHPDDMTINHLRQRGYLTEKSVDEELDFFGEIVESLHQKQLRSMPAYVIMPTYDCNLRCHYCFQDQFRTDSRYKHLLRPMSTEMADRIMASFENIEENLHGIPHEEPRHRSFTLFGGEPLLSASRPVIQHLIDSQKRDSFSCQFGAVTNGTELSAYKTLLGPDNISWLQITLDGPSAIHDKRRIYENGSGSFEVIAQNVTMALECGVRVTVRVNVDRANVSQLPQLADQLHAQGWPTSNLFSAYLAPVFDYSGLGNAGSRPDFFNTWELGEKLKDLHREAPATNIFSRVDGAIKNRIRSILEQQTGGVAKAAYCGAHLGMYIFDSFGDIYACWDRTGDDKLKIGSVESQGRVTLNGLSNVWRSRNVASNPTCRQCRFALNCGGGCAVLAEGASGSINSNFCDAFGKRFRSAVAESYMEFAAGTLQPGKSTNASSLQEFLR